MTTTMKYEPGICAVCGEHNKCTAVACGQRVGTCCWVTGEVPKAGKTDPAMMDVGEWAAHGAEMPEPGSCEMQRDLAAVALMEQVDAVYDVLEAYAADTSWGDTNATARGTYWKGGGSGAGPARRLLKKLRGES